MHFLGVFLHYYYYYQYYYFDSSSSAADASYNYYCHRHHQQHFYLFIFFHLLLLLLLLFECFVYFVYFKRNAVYCTQLASIVHQSILFKKNTHPVGPVFRL